MTLRRIRQCRINLKNKANKSGVIGVRYDPRIEKWVAYVSVNKKQKKIGNFKDFENAVLARYLEEQNNPILKVTGKTCAYKYLKENGLLP